MTMTIRMVTRKVVIITLLQDLEQENTNIEAELDKQIRQVIESSFLSRIWRVDHVAFLDDIMADQENVES